MGWSSAVCVGLSSWKIENRKPKQLVADLSLDKTVLQDALKGKL